MAALRAQAARVASEGVGLAYLDLHMGDGAHDAYDAVSRALPLPLLPQGFATSFPLASVDALGPRDGEGKKAGPPGYLAQPGPGTHLLVRHPGVAGPELSSITGADPIPYRWAEGYRRSDPAVLTDPEVRGAAERLGIERTRSPPGPRPAPDRAQSSQGGQDPGPGGGRRPAGRRREVRALVGRPVRPVARRRPWFPPGRRRRRWPSGWPARRG